MQLLAALLELVVDQCARLGTLVLRPLGAPQALGAAYGAVAWLFGLTIFLALLSGLVLLLFG